MGERPRGAPPAAAHGVGIVDAMQMHQSITPIADQLDRITRRTHYGGFGPLSTNHIPGKRGAASGTAPHPAWRCRPRRRLLLAVCGESIEPGRPARADGVGGRRALIAGAARLLHNTQAPAPTRPLDLHLGAGRGQQQQQLGPDGGPLPEHSHLLVRRWDATPRAGAWGRSRPHATTPPRNLASNAIQCVASGGRGSWMARSGAAYSSCR